MDTKEPVQIKIHHSLLPEKTVILPSTNMVSIFRKLNVPANLTVEPIQIEVKKNMDIYWKHFALFPLNKNKSYIDFIPLYVNLEYFTNKDMKYYNLNIKVKNMGNIGAKIEWRKGALEPKVSPGNELVLKYKIRSPINLPAFAVKAIDDDENELFINGKNVTHLISTFDNSNITNVLFITQGFIILNL